MNPQEILKALMDKFHWSQSDVAKRYGVTPTNVSRWLSGQRTPRGMTMVAIYEDFKQIE